MIITPAAVRPGGDKWRSSTRQTRIAHEMSTRLLDTFSGKGEVMHEDARIEEKTIPGRDSVTGAGKIGVSGSSSSQSFVFIFGCSYC